MIKVIPPERKDMLDMVTVIYRAWLQTYPNKEVGISKVDIEHFFELSFTKEALDLRWEKIQDNRVFIAKDDDVLVGVVILISHTDKNQLKAIYIMPEYQGKGIGSLLWKRAQEELPNKKWIVHCASYNARAIKVYEKWGFKDTGKRWKDDKRGLQIPTIELELCV